jgi:hypothetical protein
VDVDTSLVTGVYVNVVPLHAAPIRPMRPAAAVVATLLAGVYAVHAAYVGTLGIFDHDLVAIGSFLTLGIWGVLLAGLWNGNHLAYILVVVAASLTAISAFPGLSDVREWQDAVPSALRLALGVALLLLLVTPRSNRTFYARRP